MKYIAKQRGFILEIYIRENLKIVIVIHLDAGFPVFPFIANKTSIVEKFRRGYLLGKKLERNTLALKKEYWVIL